MTVAFQRMFGILGRWNNSQVTPSLSKPHELSYRSNIINLCCETSEQSNCSKWFKARQSRISASQNVHSIKIRRKKTEEFLVMGMLNPKNIKIKSSLCGTKNEISNLVKQKLN